MPTTRPAKKRAHGTAASYAKGGCRCDRCRRAWSAYTKDYRQRRATSPASERGKFDGKMATPTSVVLTQLGRRILSSIQARTGKSASRVVDELLRSCGSRYDAAKQQ